MVSKWTVDGEAMEPTHRILAKWVFDARDQNPIGIRRKTWKKKGFTWLLIIFILIL